MKAEDSDYGHSTERKKDGLEEYSRKEKICLSHIYRDSTQD